MEENKESKEFTKWKEKIEDGTVGILFVETYEEHYGTLIMELQEQCMDIDFDDFKPNDDAPPYIVTLVGIEGKLGRLIKLGVVEELATEFRNYHQKNISDRNEKPK